MATKPNAKIVMQATLKSLQSSTKMCSLTRLRQDICVMPNVPMSQMRTESVDISSYYPPKELTGIYGGIPAINV